MRDTPYSTRFPKFVRRAREPCVGLFELGTRSIRVSVLKKVVPREWHAWRTYSNDALTTNLGFDIGFSDHVLPLRAPSLEATIDFVNTRTECMRALGITEFNVIATSWIRRILNRDAVIDHFERVTGHSVEVIDQHREAELLISAMPQILQRTNSTDGIAEGDRIFLIDQGGGSLEIATMEWHPAIARPAITPKLFEALGTVALRQNFFNFDAGGAKVDNPELNRANIQPQIERIREHARERLSNEWGEKMMFLRGRRRAYAVGTAITNALPIDVRQHNVIHNMAVSEEMLQQRLDTVAKTYDDVKAQVLTIYKKMRGLPGSGVDRITRTAEQLDKDLVLLLGLPVYMELMRALDVQRLHVMGYPLRFGYYVWKYLEKEPISTVRSDASAPYVFISYARSEKAIVYDQLATLDAQDLRLWWDEGRGGLRVGADYEPQLEKKIRGCAAVVWFLTRGSAVSSEVEKELNTAAGYGRRILPIEIQHTTVFSEGMKAKRYDKIHRIQQYRTLPEIYLSQIREAIPPSCFKA